MFDCIRVHGEYDSRGRRRFLLNSRSSGTWHIVILLVEEIFGLFKMVLDCL